LSLVAGFGLASLPITIFILLIVGMVQGKVPLGILIMYTVAMTLLSLPLAIGFAIGMKWLVIRRYKPGRYPLWGFYYFRWWLATRVQSVSGMTFFEGTPDHQPVLSADGRKGRQELHHRYLVLRHLRSLDRR
jgi:hypothetical protein